MDRVLHLIRCVDPNKRSSLGYSVWKDSRVPFDRVYADEVQDLTQAELTLFVLCCNNNVDGLFLAGDNAQAITGGVSFRFEELRSIINRADRKRKQPRTMDLVRNYRSHSGIIDLAAQVLELLEISFQGSFSKLNPDSGLSRGARPGLWSPPDSYTSMQNALFFERKFIIITRDEHKEHLKAALEEDERLGKLPVLGIVETKGLEFNEVLLVDFFSSAKRNIKEGWQKMLSLPELHQGAMRQGGGIDSKILMANKHLSQLVEGKVNKELEVDMKMLYTAITRCRNRLVVCETNENENAWGKFKRIIHNKLSLAMPCKLAESVAEGGEMKTMMPDEAMQHAIQFIEMGEDAHEPAEKLSGYNNAVTFLHMAERTDVLARVEVAKTHVNVWDTLRRTSSASLGGGEGGGADAAANDDGAGGGSGTDGEGWKAREELAVQAAEDFLKVGMARHALEVCRLASDDLSVVQPIKTRLENMMRAWQTQAQAEPEAAPAGSGGGGAGGGGGGGGGAASEDG